MESDSDDDALLFNPELAVTDESSARDTDSQVPETQEEFAVDTRAVRSPSAEAAGSGDDSDGDGEFLFSLQTQAVPSFSSRPNTTPAEQKRSTVASSGSETDDELTIHPGSSTTRSDAAKRGPARPAKLPPIDDGDDSSSSVELFNLQTQGVFENVKSGEKDDDGDEETQGMPNIEEDDDDDAIFNEQTQAVCKPVINPTDSDNADDEDEALFEMETQMVETGSDAADGDISGSDDEMFALETQVVEREDDNGDISDGALSVEDVFNMRSSAVRMQDGLNGSVKINQSACNNSGNIDQSACSKSTDNDNSVTQDTQILNRSEEVTSPVNRKSRPTLLLKRATPLLNRSEMSQPTEAHRKAQDCPSAVTIVDDSLGESSDGELRGSPDIFNMQTQAVYSRPLSDSDDDVPLVDNRGAETATQDMFEAETQAVFDRQVDSEDDDAEVSPLDDALFAAQTQAVFGNRCDTHNDSDNDDEDDDSIFVAETQPVDLPNISDVTEVNETIEYLESMVGETPETETTKSGRPSKISLEPPDFSVGETPEKADDSKIASESFKNDKQSSIGETSERDEDNKITIKSAEDVKSSKVSLEPPHFTVGETPEKADDSKIASESFKNDKQSSIGETPERNEDNKIVTESAKDAKSSKVSLEPPDFIVVKSLEDEDCKMTARSDKCNKPTTSTPLSVDSKNPSKDIHSSHAASPKLEDLIRETQNCQSNLLEKGHDMKATPPSNISNKNLTTGKSKNLPDDLPSCVKPSNSNMSTPISESVILGRPSRDKQKTQSNSEIEANREVNNDLAFIAATKRNRSQNRNKSETINTAESSEAAGQTHEHSCSKQDFAQDEDNDTLEGPECQGRTKTKNIATDSENAKSKSKDVQECLMSLESPNISVPKTRSAKDSASVLKGERTCNTEVEKLQDKPEVINIAKHLESVVNKSKKSSLKQKIATKTSVLITESAELDKSINTSNAKTTLSGRRALKSAKSRLPADSEAIENLVEPENVQTINAGSKTSKSMIDNSSITDQVEAKQDDTALPIEISNSSNSELAAAKEPKRSRRQKQGKSKAITSATNLEPVLQTSENTFENQIKQTNNHEQICQSTAGNRPTSKAAESELESAALLSLVEDEDKDVEINNVTRQERPKRKATSEKATSKLSGDALKCSEYLELSSTCVQKGDTINDHESLSNSEHSSNTKQEQNKLLDSPEKTNIADKATRKEKKGKLESHDELASVEESKLSRRRKQSQLKSKTTSKSSEPTAIPACEISSSEQTSAASELEKTSRRTKGGSRSRSKPTESDQKTPVASAVSPSAKLFNHGVEIGEQSTSTKPSIQLAEVSDELEKGQRGKGRSKRKVAVANSEETTSKSQDVVPGCSTLIELPNTVVTDSQQAHNAKNKQTRLKDSSVTTNVGENSLSGVKESKKSLLKRKIIAEPSKQAIQIPELDGSTSNTKTRSGRSTSNPSRFRSSASTEAYVPTSRASRCRSTKSAKILSAETDQDPSTKFDSQRLCSNDLLVEPAKGKNKRVSSKNKPVGASDVADCSAEGEIETPFIPAELPAYSEQEDCCEMDSISVPSNELNSITKTRQRLYRGNSVASNVAENSLPVEKLRNSSLKDKLASKTVQKRVETNKIGHTQITKSTRASRNVLKLGDSAIKVVNQDENINVLLAQGMCEEQPTETKNQQKGRGRPKRKAATSSSVADGEESKPARGNNVLDPPVSSGLSSSSTSKSRRKGDASSSSNEPQPDTKTNQRGLRDNSKTAAASEPVIKKSRGVTVSQKAEAVISSQTIQSIEPTKPDSDTENQSGKGVSRRPKVTPSDLEIEPNIPPKIRPSRRGQPAELTDNVTITVPLTKQVMKKRTSRAVDPVSSVSDMDSVSVRSSLESTPIKRARISSRSSRARRTANSSILSQCSLETPGSAATRTSLRTILDTPALIKVMFTGISDPTLLEKIVAEMGCSTTTDVSKCTHLIANEAKRTIKFLCAINLGLNVITSKWLTDSQKEGKCQDLDKYLLKDKKSEKEYNYNLQSSLQTARNNPDGILSDCRICVTKSTKPPPSEFKEIVLSAGGRFHNAIPKSASDNLYVISCLQDEKIFKPLISSGYQVVSKEFILTGILRQRLEASKFLMT